jgi:hypothetical protein
MAPEEISNVRGKLPRRFGSASREAYRAPEEADRAWPTP